jgi:hypothetical protein
MKEQRARDILQSLVDGIDPSTGEDLPPGSILQKAEVLRALLVGLTALETVAARAQRRAQLPGNVGHVWSEEEEKLMVEAFKCGESPAEIAARHARTLRAIEARLEKLGLISADQRTTSTRYVGSMARRGASRA